VRHVPRRLYRIKDGNGIALAFSAPRLQEGCGGWRRSACSLPGGGGHGGAGGKVVVALPTAVLPSILPRRNRIQTSRVRHLYRLRILLDCFAVRNRMTTSTSTTRLTTIVVRYNICSAKSVIVARDLLQRPHLEQPLPSGPIQSNPIDVLHVTSHSVSTASARPPQHPLNT